MRCIVTGCAGFIGSHLAERLIGDGHEVIGVDCFTDYYAREIKESNVASLRKKEGFSLIEEDILNIDCKNLLRDVNVVFHQAAQAGVRASWGKSFEIYANCNIRATQVLLEACKESDIEKFVYASSSSIYGDTKDLPIKETTIPRPFSPYGVTKLAGEHLSYLYWKNYEVPAVSLRYFSVYGPRQRPDMGFHRFINAILNGQEIAVFGDGNQSRDFTYVSDIIEANILALRSKNGEIFNIGGGSKVTVNDVVKILERLTGNSAKVSHTVEQKGDVRHTYADISKARKVLGYKPMVKLEEGLKKQIGWIKT